MPHIPGDQLIFPEQTQNIPGYMRRYPMLSKYIPEKFKKLGKWLTRIQNCVLFNIGKNAKYTTEQLMQIPIIAALNNYSIGHASLTEGKPSEDDFYYHVNNKLTEEAVSKMIYRYSTEILKFLKNIFHTSAFKIAIDYTENLYYGETKNPFIVGGKRKNGTNYGFKYLTVAIVNKGMRFVIFAYPVKKEDNADTPLVQKGLRVLYKLGIEMIRVLLDREFYNADIIAMLNFLGIEFIIPSKKDEKFERMMRSIIEQKKRDGLLMQFPYVVQDYPLGEEFVTQIVFEEKNSKGEKEIHAYITNRKLADIKADPYAVQEDYSERWAIENANKFQDSFNIHTNCTNGIVRFFFFALTLLLHNFWVLVNLFTRYIPGCLKLSLRIFKEIISAILGIAPMPHYKHVQRKPWAFLLNALLNVGEYIRLTTGFFCVFAFFSFENDYANAKVGKNAEFCLNSI